VSDDTERRKFQRLTLLEPLDGWFGDYAVRLLNVSATGALIECDEEIPPDSRALLRFFWRGHEVELLAETQRTNEGQAGLAFVEDSSRLRELIADSATELLRAQRANLLGLRDENTVGDETLTAASSGAFSSTFITWTHNGGEWKCKPSMLADQPPDGFTVRASEPPEQVALLRETYESGDTQARQLTRMLAELSVASRTTPAR
jgi:hypothetical protein